MAFLKRVVFGVDDSQYYVESEWGTHWTIHPDPGAAKVFQERKAAGNSTVAIAASFGPGGQYFLLFDGWKYWNIKDPDMKKIVKENAVKFVSFGPKGAIIVVLKSGGYYFRILTARQYCITILKHQAIVKLAGQKDVNVHLVSRNSAFASKMLRQHPWSTPGLHHGSFQKWQ